MKNLLNVILIAMSINSFAQSNYKILITDDDQNYIQEQIEIMMVSDQLFRGFLVSKTLDYGANKKLDELYRSGTIEEIMTFKKENRGNLTQSEIDSIGAIQNFLDEMNLNRFVDLVSTYGYLGDDLLGEKSGHFFALLLHFCPKTGVEQDVWEFVDKMTELLIPEVEAGRMEAEAYAKFYDNTLGKILRKPQLYGTNHRWDMENNRQLLPLISNIEETNRARIELGLLPLKKGEYSLE